MQYIYYIYIMCARVCVCLFVLVLYLYILDILDMYTYIKNHRKNCFFFYNIIDYNWTRQKTNEKYFTKRQPKKRQENTSTNLTTLSNTTVKKVIKQYQNNVRKQYQNNGTENLLVVIIYLIEALKMKEDLNYQKEAIRLLNDWANFWKMN